MYTVWPGSHRLLAMLAASDPTRFQLMHTLGQALEEAGVLEIEPVEVKAQRGDVLFYDILTAHSGSENHAAGCPRLAFNMKWGISPEQQLALAAVCRRPNWSRTPKSVHLSCTLSRKSAAANNLCLQVLVPLTLCQIVLFPGNEMGHCRDYLR